MAKNTNKRISIKWVRDRAKSAYEKDSKCFVCGSCADLELHHLHSMTLLLDRWCQVKGIQLVSDEDILAVRDQFIQDHYQEIYTQVYTLCNKHHVRLHQVFGKAPGLQSALKQQRWLELQQNKFTNPDQQVEKSYGSWFSEFTGR